jgi:hypothetical protein
MCIVGFIRWESDMTAKLKITRWYEGEMKSAPGVSHLRPDTHFVANGGGWKSLDEMRRTRMADIAKYNRPISVVATEFGFRTDEPCRGALEGLTRVEVVEFLAV